MNVNIQVLLQEDREFPPPAEFAAKANVRDPGVYEEAARDREGFWANFAEELHWFKRWDQVLEWDPPIAKWFAGGKINVAYNCLDRHLTAGRHEKEALIWEGEPGDSKVYTYGDLHREVCRFANGLKSLGVRKGDMVALYLPNLPELPIAMLACARIGAAHNAVFSGFGPEALGDRIQESKPKVLITCDGSYRRGVVTSLKRNVDAALASAPALGKALDKVVVVRRTGAADDLMQPGRDIWWDELTSGQPLQCDSEPMDSEDTLYWLYTSGTTGRPKGVIHTTAGYLLGTYATAKWVFDLKDHDIHWCTADVGGVTGHSYTVYGPLANGATTVMYEGSPEYPERDRFWSIVEKYGVTVIYTHPTVIRSFIRWGEELPARHDLSSLRLLGTVGEPINPEAWMWYWENIGGGRCPVVNTWWQTETGMIMIAPLPGITTLKPGSPTRPFPGVDARVVDSAGRPAAPGEGGHLVINGPWPAMLRPAPQDTIRVKERYWSHHPNSYYPGDGSNIDQDGYIWMLGRVVDLIHTPAHSLSNTELESALVNHRGVAEAACIGVNQSEDGHAIVAFVTLKETVPPSPSLGEELKHHVEMELGPTARPDHVLFAAELPKTLSGKIMRRLLVEIVEGRDIGDVTSLADFSVVEALKSQFGPKQPGSLTRV